MKLRNFLTSLIGILTSLSSPIEALADSLISTPHLLELNQKTEEFRLRFFLSIGGTVLSTRTGLFTGVVPAFGVQYSLFDHWGFESSFQEAFFTSNFAPFFSHLDLRIIYAFKGKLIRRSKDLEISGFTTINQNEFLTGGIRLGLTADFVFYDSSNIITPYTGLGGILYYEFNDSPIYLGARVSRLTSGSASLYPINLFVGFFF